MLIREAAPLIRGRNGEPLTARSLQKRIVNSLKTDAGRQRWREQFVDPDHAKYGFDDEFTDEMKSVLGVILESGTDVKEEKSPNDIGPQETVVLGPATLVATFTPEPIAKPLTKPSKKKSKPARVKEDRPLPRWLVDVLVAMAPIAEGYSFAKIGTIAYPDMGMLGQGGWAIIGYTIGLIAFVNYARIEDQTKADVWAVVLAILQFLTHMSASGWNLKAATASLLIVAASWAINAAWKKK